MSPVHSADTLWVKNFIKIALYRTVFQDKCVLAFYAEIQDGCQRWPESNFCKKSPIDSADTLKIALSHTVFQDKCVLVFYAEIQNGCQKWQESDFCEKSPVHSGHPGVENFDEIPLSCTVKEIEANLCFSIFGENSKCPSFIERGKSFENWQE